MFALFSLLCFCGGSSRTSSLRFAPTFGGGFGILKRVGNASLFNIFLLVNISSSKWSPHILRLHRDPGSLFITSFHLQFTAHLLIYCMNSDKNVHVTTVSCIKTFWYKIIENHLQFSISSPP